MTETEALQNQFHDELHNTNLKILDVSTNLAALGDRVDAISDSNAEVNKNINNFSLILDDHSTRIKDLEGQTRQTAKEVAVRAAKSVTRSINDSEIAELHNEIHEVAVAVDDTNANLEPRVRNLEIDVAELQDDVADLNAEDSSIWEAMEDMDVEHHEELHRLALAIDNHDSSISTLWNRTNVYIEENDLNINNLQEEDSSIWNAMQDMDVEHHEELHRLAMAIDNHETRIEYLEDHWFNYESEIDRLENKIDASIAEIKYSVDSSISDMKDDIDDVSTGLSNITRIVNNLPPHVVLTKEEYDDLDNPDYNTFYFTYEDEE